MKFSNNNNDRRLIDELKSVGEALRNVNETHRESLRGRLHLAAPKYENKKSGFRFPKLGLALIPTLSVAAVAALAIISAAYRPTYYSAEPFLSDDTMEMATESSIISMDSDILDATSYSETTGLGAQTFKSRFLRNIGRHDVPQGQVDEYRKTNGDFFEQDIRFNLLSKEKDALSEVTDIYTRLDGYIEQSRAHNTDSFTITGRIPKNNLSALRNELNEFVGSDNFYLESTNSYNRVKDVIVVDEKIQEVEDAIIELETLLASETNATIIKELNEELIQHRAFLRERTETKDAIIERVEYVDVSITITTIESWINADSYWELNQAISGYDQPGFGERILINVAYVITRIILFLSYTFWILIPLGIWLGMKKRRNTLFSELD
jgi:hypothetical protein